MRPTPLNDTRRGDLARERLLLAALDLFGRHGFEATTTRMIAQAACMNLGAIPYYFGAKEDLYLGAADHLAAYIEAAQAEPLARLQAQVRQGTGDLSEALMAFILAEARLLLVDQVPASWVQFFLRAQTEHDAAFERVFARVLEPVQRCLDEALARITGLACEDTRTRVLSFWLLHQFVCLRLADAVLLRRLGWEALTPARATQLLDMLTPHLRAQILYAAKPANTP